MKLFHRHKWGPWHIVSRYKVLTKWLWDSGTSGSTGEGFRQERTCETCGFTQLNQQEVSL